MGSRSWLAVVAFASVSLAGCAGEGDALEAEADPDILMLRGFVMTEALVPITAAEVEVDGRDLAAVTDAEGAFSLGPLEPGPYRLLARANGYSETSEIVTLGADTGNLTIRMAAVSKNVPYHEVQKFFGYVECSYGGHAGPVPLGNFNCLGAIDLVLGTDLSNDEDEYFVEFGGPGFKGVMIEMVWDAQATGEHWSGYLREPPPTAGGLGLEAQYWAASGTSPLRALVVAGTENAGNYDGDVFHPDENETRVYELTHAGVWDSSEPVDVSIMLRTEIEIFVSTFYYQLPGDDYTALGCEACE